jgi:hypothetical protein
MRTVLSAEIEAPSLPTSTKRREVITVLMPAAMHALRSASGPAV